jgi:CheY-like chemotaxis protein
MRLVASPGSPVILGGEQRSAPLHRSTASRGQVLVVEDNELNQMVAEGALGALGYGVRLAGNGIEALGILAEETFDAVLMDCHMPGMDGYQATAELRRREDGGPRLPVIAMTAGVLAEDRTKCTEAGMDDFIPKPVDLDVLRDVLIRWIDDRRTAATGGAAALPRPRPEPEPLPGADDALDRARLDLLRSLPGPSGAGLLDVVVASFAADAPARLAALRSAVDSGDLVLATAAAHALKGAAGNLGATRVAALSGELETAGRDGDLVAARDLLARLDTQLREALSALSRLEGSRP